MEITVRVSETDMLGHVNHANYFTYMEEARINYLKELGIKINNKGCTIVLASATCDFIRQAFSEDVLLIDTYVKKVGQRSFTLGNDIVDKQSEQLIARGELVIVYFDMDKQKSADIPGEIKEKLTEKIEQRH